MWQTVQRGHAIANGCWLAVANRCGLEGNENTERSIEFWGKSFICDYQGKILQQASSDGQAILIAECDLKAKEQHRQWWPFFRDRRVDSYADLWKR